MRETFWHWHDSKSLLYEGVQFSLEFPISRFSHFSFVSGSRSVKDGKKDFSVWAQFFFFFYLQQHNGNDNYERFINIFLKVDFRPGVWRYALMFMCSLLFTLKWVNFMSVREISFLLQSSHLWKRVNLSRKLIWNLISFSFAAAAENMNIIKHVDMGEIWNVENPQTYQFLDQ